jgi:hypothetical protein
LHFSGFSSPPALDSEAGGCIFNDPGFSATRVYRYETSAIRGERDESRVGR